MARLRAILVRVVIAGLIGVVATVGVAVGCAMMDYRAAPYPISTMLWRNPTHTGAYLWDLMEDARHGRTGYVISEGGRSQGRMGRCPLPPGADTVPLQHDVRLLRTAG